VAVKMPKLTWMVMALQTAMTDVPMIKPSSNLASVVVALQKWTRTAMAPPTAMMHARMA